MSTKGSVTTADQFIRTILSVLFVLAFLIGLPAGNVFAAPLAAINYQQFATLTATDSGDFAHFGTTLAIEGPVAVVGVPDATVSGKIGAGAVYIFNRDQGGVDSWGFVQKLVASDGIAGDQFGYSVAISGKTIIVGARDVPMGINVKAAGAAYIFQRAGTALDSWAETQKLTAHDFGKNDRFGTAVAIHDNIAFVGSPMEDPASTNSGASYVFTRDSESVPFQEAGKLAPPDQTKAVGDRYGSAMALDSETLVVGAPMMKIGSNQGQGMTYVYSYFKDADGTYKFTNTAQLKIATGQGSDNFGKSVAISNNIIAIGAPSTTGSNTGGAAYLYKRSATGVWEQLKKETPSTIQTGNLFGTAVALDGDLLAIGAPGDTVNSLTSAGQIYLFARNEGGTDAWNEVGPISVIDGTSASNDKFGAITGISGSTVLGGVPNKRLTLAEQGAVYVMRAKFQLEIDLNGPDNSSIDYSTSYTEGSAPVSITDPTSTITNVAGTQLDKMVITITNLRDGADESLSATASGAIAQSDIQYVQVDAQTSTLTIDPPGTAPMSDFFAVLHSAKYLNTSNNPTTAAPRTIRFWATGDGVETMQEPATYVTIIPVNDAPAILVKPAVFITPNNVQLNFLDKISLSDPDSGDNYLKVSLSVDSGSLTLGSLTGLTFTTGDGTADPAMVFTATLADANKALLNMLFTPDAMTGKVTMSLAVDDQGNTGGGALTASTTLDVTVYDSSVDNPPTGISPTSAEVREDAQAGTVVVNAFTATDPDAGDTFTFALVSAQGCDQNVPFALTGSTLTSTAALNYETKASYTLCVQVTDHSGLPFLQPVTISVLNVNEAPVNHLPGSQTVDEDTPLSLTTLSVSDVDAAQNSIQVSLSVAHGKLALNDAGLLTVTGSNSAAMTITGGQDAINAAFSKGLVYTPALNYNGSDSLTITTNDQGANGLGGPLSATGSIAITINAVKDPSQVVILGTNPDMPHINQPFMVSFQVTSAAGTPTGDVTVTANVNGSNVTCHGTLDASGKGSCGMTIKATGDFSFTAQYSGDSQFLASASNPYMYEVLPYAMHFTTIYANHK